MNRILIVIGTVAGIILLVPVIPYVSMYGFHWVNSQEVWGQFGDFFGGLLNPIYAFLAFLALLYTTSLQAAEFKRTANSMQQQLNHLKHSAEKEDIFKIIKDIDDDLEAILKTVVSPDGAQTELNVNHIIHEGFRLRNESIKTQSYNDFISLANSSGSIVESVYLRLALSIGSLFRHLNMYYEISNESSYVSDYFRYKYFYGRSTSKRYW